MFLGPIMSVMFVLMGTDAAIMEVLLSRRLFSVVLFIRLIVLSLFDGEIEAEALLHSETGPLIDTFCSRCCFITDNITAYCAFQHGSF